MASSALKAETRAMLKRLLEADRRNIKDVKILSDSIQLVQAVYIGHKLAEIYSLIVDMNKV